MKKILLIAIPLGIIALVYWEDITQIIQTTYQFITTPIIWKIQPWMICVWTVWKFHKYIWTDKVDISSGEKIGTYKSLQEAEFKTKKYIQQNYESGYSQEKWEEPIDNGKGGWKYVDFVFKVAHTVCTVIFVPVNEDKL